MPTGEIRFEHVAGASFLAWGGSLGPISDLSGIQCLPALIGINLSDNNINDLTPLSELTSLTYLTLQHASIADLRPLSGLTSLTWLDLDGNSITDLTALSGLGAVPVTIPNTWEHDV
jgi:Leucine-rich repeat (LRR) protein